MGSGGARPHNRPQSRILARNAPLIDSDSDDGDYMPAYMMSSSDSESLVADSEEEQLNQRDRR